MSCWPPRRFGVVFDFGSLWHTELNLGQRKATVPVADCEPGAEVRGDFGRLGMLTDETDVRRRVGVWGPRDKPRVERTVTYVRSNFSAVEQFRDLVDCPMRAEHWCAQTAEMRIHGITWTRPAERSPAEEAPALGPTPEGVR
jgi:hypothetical protein